MQKRLWGSTALTAVLFVLAAALLGFGTIGAIQAAPRIESRDYRAEVVLTNIETAITEYSEKHTEANQVTGKEEHYIVREGNMEASDDLDHDGLSGLMTTFLEDNDETEIRIGNPYDYKLAVRNIAPPDRNGGGIPQYVRVSVYKYWVAVDESGAPDPDEKRIDLDPALIDLHFVTGENGWSIDQAASTKERTVLYYDGILNPGDNAPNFTDKLTIDGKVMRAVKEAKVDNPEFKYDNVQFRIKATVDAVQTHNGTAAMTSAWGRTNK